MLSILKYKLGFSIGCLQRLMFSNFFPTHIDSISLLCQVHGWHMSSQFIYCCTCKESKEVHQLISNLKTCESLKSQTRSSLLNYFGILLGYLKKFIDFLPFRRKFLLSQEYLFVDLEDNHLLKCIFFLSIYT